MTPAFRLAPARDMLISSLLSALMWPGAGQFYNREFKKGLALTLLTLLLGVSLMIGLGKDIAHVLPANPSPFDPEQMARMKAAILSANPKFYRTYSMLLSATWLFGVVDACLGARERATRLRPPPENPG